MSLALNLAHEIGCRHHSGGGVVDSYAKNGFSPKLVADFVNEFYRSLGVTTDFDTLLGSPGRTDVATFYNSSGNLIYNAHNLALNSASPATQSITVVVGFKYKVHCTGTGSLTLSDAGTGSASDGSPVEITASTTTLTLTLVGSLDTMWVHQSPADETYVATTGSPVYKMRRGSHVYNGSAWVHRGIRIETVAKTNLEVNSTNPAAGSSGNGNATWTSGADDPFGGTDAYALRGDATNGQHFRSFNNAGISFVSGSNYVFSVWIKVQGSQRYVSLALNSSRFPATERHVTFDLQTGDVELEETNTKGFVENFGGGYYRLSLRATASSNGTNTNSYFIGLSDDGTHFPTYVGSTSDGVDVYGFQIEESDYPSSHIPTSGATVTRSVDSNLNIASAQTSFPGTGGAVSMHHKAMASYEDTNQEREVFLTRWQANATNYFRQTIRTVNTETGRARLISRNPTDGIDASQTAADYYPPDLNVAINLASRHTADVVQGAADGVALAENSGPTILPDLSTSDIALGLIMDGHISQFVQWDVDIGQAGIVEATT